jgi:glycyl-tRNA synthetase beta subunit
MVGEFPELQGTMGRHYALHSGEPQAVADAIEQHYLPRFAGDDIPPGTIGQVVGLADRMDTLVAIFAAGLKPTGNKDPFALRRAALGLVRILAEARLELPPERLLALARTPSTPRARRSSRPCSAKVKELSMNAPGLFSAMPAIEQNWSPGHGFRLEHSCLICRPVSRP